MTFNILMLSGCVLQLAGFIVGGFGLYHRHDLWRVIGGCLLVFGFGILTALTLLEI